VNDATGDPAAPAGAKLTLLERREIEARIVGPLVRAFVARFGEVEALEVVQGVIGDLARDAGAALAVEAGDRGLPTFGRSLDRWKAGGALELTVLEGDDHALSFDVTRCRYAEMYKALGLGDLGFSLSCRRDFALIEGFNPGVELTRTQTIMEGAPHCDFRFRAKSAAGPGPERPPV